MAEDKPRIPGMMENVRNRVANMVKMPRASWALSGGKVAGSAAGVQEKTKAQIRDVLQATIDDPELVKDFGLKLPTVAAGPQAPAAPPAAPEVDGKDLAALACEFLSRGSVMLARRAGFSERVAGLAAWDGNERAALIPAAARVINKYLPADLGKWAEEIELATKCIALVVAKIQLLREANARENANPARPAGSTVVDGAFGS